MAITEQAAAQQEREENRVNPWSAQIEALESLIDLQNDVINAYRAEVDRLNWNDHYQAVRDFHDAIGGPSSNRDVPGFPIGRVRDLRLKLIEEEFEELEVAVRVGDLVAVADAIGDLLYVVYGAAAAFGLPIHEVFNEIHRSNMSKAGGPVRADGKVLKPEGWQPPQLIPILEAAARADGAA